MANMAEARRRFAEEYDVEMPSSEDEDSVIMKAEYPTAFPTKETILHVLGLDGIYYDIRYVLTSLLVHM